MSWSENFVDGPEFPVGFGAPLESPQELRNIKRAGLYGLDVLKIVTPNLYLLRTSCGSCVAQFEGLEALEDNLNEKEAKTMKKYWEYWEQENAAQRKAEDKREQAAVTS